MHLATTPIEATWGKSKEIIFLGEWCKLYSRREKWSKLNYRVLPYHWDDRDLYYNDYLYLTTIYEKHLILLVEQLNKLHNQKHSVRFWRIFIGPWLRYFIDCVFDRYKSIIIAANHPDISSTSILNSHPGDWIPTDFNNFYQNYTKDSWNHFIYGEIIKMTDTIPYKIINNQNHKLKYKYKVTSYRSVQQKCKNSVLNIYGKIVSNKINKVVFVSSYFPKSDLIKLQLKLGQVPFFIVPTYKYPEVVTDMNLRSQLKINNQKDSFEKILNYLIPLQIPKTYIEGYNKLQRLANEKYPRNIKIIYTANAYSHDDDFKYWAGVQVENGTKLYIGQHGGNFGTGLWAQDEDHQIKISDRYFTWGWKENKYKNLKPVSASKLININRIKIEPDKEGQVLLVLASFPRYFYCSYSVPTANQYLDYINNQIKLLKLLDSNVLSIIKIRLDSDDYGWDLYERFVDAGYTRKVEEPKESLFKRLKKCRLCIATHNATVFLETFSANFPTLLFWDSKYYEIRQSATKSFLALENAGLLYHDPESVAKKINQIYTDTDSWWMQEDLQSVKNLFCKKYAYISDNWLTEWKKELTQNDIKA